MELPILLVRVRLMNRSGNVSKDRTSRSPPVGSGQSPTKSWYYWRARFVRGTMSRGTKVQRKYVVHTSVDPNIGEDPLINFGLLFFLQFLLVSVIFYFAVRMFRCFSLSNGHYHKIHISSMCSRILTIVNNLLCSPSPLKVSSFFVSEGVASLFCHQYLDK